MEGRESLERLGDESQNSFITIFVFENLNSWQCRVGLGTMRGWQYSSHGQSCWWWSLLCFSLLGVTAMTTHIHSEQGSRFWSYAIYGQWCLADNTYYNGQWWWSWLSFSFLCHWQLWHHTLATKREEFEDMRDVDRVALGTIVAAAESQTGLGLGVTLRKPSLKRRPFRLNSWWDCAHRGIFLLWTFTFSIPLLKYNKV